MNHAELNHSHFIEYGKDTILGFNLEDGSVKPVVVFNRQSVNENWYNALQSMPVLYQALTQNHNAIQFLIDFCAQHKSALDVRTIIATMDRVLGGCQETILLAQRISQEGQGEVAKAILADARYQSLRNDRETPP